MSLPIEKTGYTFADYLVWEENEHIELLNGELIMMAPPSTRHQLISGELFRQLANFLEGKKCRVFHAPFGVRLFEEKNDKPENIQTVFEPDISVICDLNKLDKYGCKGAPDFIIEILSPSTQKHDRIIKLQQYQRAGVKEYWIVSPEDETVQIFLLDNTQNILFPVELYEKNDIAKVNVLEGCFIELKKVFDNI